MKRYCDVIPVFANDDLTRAREALRLEGIGWRGHIAFFNAKYHTVHGEPVDGLIEYLKFMTFCEDSPKLPQPPDS